MILRKVIWYVTNLWRLCIVSVRILLHCLASPRKFYQLFFSMFSLFNEFYQVSHGRLRNFEDTVTYQQLKKGLYFVQCNYFDSDSRVTRPVETQILATLVKYFQPKTVFEIGTYFGFTTLHFACNTPDNAVIYTMDLPVEGKMSGRDQGGIKASYDDVLVKQLSRSGVQNRFYKRSAYKEKIVEIYGDSLHFDFTPYHGKIDFIFIDGNHSYPYVKSDTENAFKMVSPNGVIVWHDYDYIVHRDVFKYLNQLSGEKKIYSIPNTRLAIYGPSL